MFLGGGLHTLFHTGFKSMEMLQVKPFLGLDSQTAVTHEFWADWTSNSSDAPNINADLHAAENPRTALRYSDYYSMLSLKDFTDLVASGWNGGLTPSVRQRTHS